MNARRKELVKLLASLRVSTLPVLDDRGRVLGVVFEADLLPKQEQPAPDRLAAIDWLGDRPICRRNRGASCGI